MKEPHIENLLSKDYGYLLVPPRRPTEPGYAGIEIVLCEQPSLSHFDPDQVLLLVSTSDGSAETLKVTHPWIGSARWRLCVGQVDLLDRKGKHVDFFTFGGELTIEKAAHGCTHLTLSSEAPFLLTQSQTSPVNLLIQEVEIQMAQARAEWLGKNQNFDSCLASIEPFELYRMCLAAILQRIGQFSQRDEAVFRLCHVLKDELDVIGFPALSLTDL
jgi:hypothetical protein